MPPARRQARVEVDITRFFEAQGRHRETLAHAMRGLSLARAASGGEGSTTLADALNQVGWFLTKAAHFQEAIEYCQQSVAMHRRIGDKHGEPPALDSLAFAYRTRLSAPEGHDPAMTLINAGDADHDGGDIPAAREAWIQALDIFESLQHRDASEVRVRLSRTDAKAKPGGLNL